MERRTYHRPAMAPQEAALLPALAPVYPTIPLREADFRPMHSKCSMQPQIPRSAAGRAILHAEGVHLPGVTRMRKQRSHP